MAKKGGVYQIRNTIDGKVYVGSAVHFSRRWREHRRRLNKGDHHSPHFQSAWLRFGGDAFVFEILEIVEDAGQLVVAEQKYLDRIRPFDNSIGYNVCSNAESRLGTKQTDEWRAAMSALNKERGYRPGAQAHAAAREARKGSTHTVQARAKISAMMKAKGCRPSNEQLSALHESNRGRRQTGEQCTKKSKSFRARGIRPSAACLAAAAEASRARVQTPEERARRSAASRGKLHSAEAKAKISASRKGKNTGPLSDEHRAKLSAALTGHAVSPETRAKISATKRAAAQAKLLEVMGPPLPSDL